jgi:tetratricopeptide (TPR) repeat protein
MSPRFGSGAFAVRACFYAVAALLVLRPASAGDQAMAKFLLDAGKKAIEKKQYDDALTKLQRARVEDTSLFEADYWIAFAYDKKGVPSEALKSYRAFRDACRREQETAPLSKELDALAKKGEARLVALAAGETELQKLNDPFVASMLALAKTLFVRDAALAQRALDAVLAVQPDHEEAKRLREKIPAEGAAPAASAPATEAASKGEPGRASANYPDIKRWRDLLGSKAFGTFGGWTYGESTLTIDYKQGGSYYWPAQVIRTPARYVLELEVRVRRFDGPRWTVGFGFAKQGENYLSMFFSRSEVITLQFKGGPPTELTRPGGVTPVEQDTWHRFAVDVDGARARAWFDDKPVVSVTLPAENLAGDVSIYHQDNRCEFRVLRLGTKE